jgi:hypothetical protein
MSKIQNPITAVMNEYVVWGGPVVTRAEAFADCKAKGIPAKGIDILVFGRQSVPAPADPEAHVEMLRQIQAMGW